jgi:hypothetical protein
VLKPRASTTVAVAVIEEFAFAAEVVSVALLPVPLMLPADEVYEYDNELLSRLWAATDRTNESPGLIVCGLTEQVAVGGRGCLTVNDAEQLATLFFFSLASVAVAETV